MLMPLPFQPIWLEAVTGLLHHSARENSFSYTQLPVWENSPQVLLFIKFQSSPLLHKILLTPGAKKCRVIARHFKRKMLFTLVTSNART